MSIFKNLFIISAFLFMPIIVFAGGDFVYDVAFLSKNSEITLEFINIIIAILAAAYAIKLAALTQGGDLENTWNLIAVVAVLFAVFEAYGVLKGLGLVHITGLGDVIELIFGLTLLVTVYKTRKTLLERMMSK